VGAASDVRQPAIANEQGVVSVPPPPADALANDFALLAAAGAIGFVAGALVGRKSD
jgi:hypothetical protein